MKAEPQNDHIRLDTFVGFPFDFRAYVDLTPEDAEWLIAALHRSINELAELTRLRAERTPK